MELDSACRSRRARAILLHLQHTGTYVIRVPSVCLCPTLSWCVCDCVFVSFSLSLSAYINPLFTPARVQFSTGEHYWTEPSMVLPEQGAARAPPERPTCWPRFSAKHWRAQSARRLGRLRPHRRTALRQLDA